MRLADLPTPCLVLDRAGLGRAVAHAARVASDRGVGLRPSLSIARSLDVAQVIFAAMGGRLGAPPPVAVSTLAEAEYFVSHGILDLLYAVPIVPDKVPQLTKLDGAGAELGVVVADPDTAAALAGAPPWLRAFVLVGPAGGWGLSPGGADWTLTVQRLGFRLAGAVAAAPRDGVATASSRLRGATGALASTGPAGRHAILLGSAALAGAPPLEGVAEIVPGSALFGILPGVPPDQWSPAALSVLATVLATAPDQDGAGLLIDAGASALGGGEPGTLLGRVAGAGTDAGWEASVLALVDAECGFVPARGASPPVAAVGQRVRVVPHRPVVAAAVYDRFHVVDGSDEVVAIWPRVTGW